MPGPDGVVQGGQVHKRRSPTLTRRATTSLSLAESVLQRFWLRWRHTTASITTLSCISAVRSAADVPFRQRIEKLGTSVKVYDKSKGQHLDIREIVRTLKWNSQLYFCGPTRMIESGRRAVQEFGVDENEVHYEAFSADTTGDPFDAEVSNRAGKIVHVTREETLLEVLKREFGGDQVESSCEVGNCGTCKINLKDGTVEHRGTALTTEQKGSSMLSCVSRGIGRIVVEV
ncbi:3-chlorobenzoate-3,4-dioxygenase reductase subunit [Verticillium alfalfae VaMs.102]|uniref:3-chlorobenzoate-3,4-dioxygenase reductase subunit n=1 Tax=Verticillium alfalfae (strain VaMs.102 / ATCC MYA-4576 / FGSC 10136) TaxID=526221 RepID=C9S5F7_VERA1|nr:3-chlorobenzoate-3,4-dioxygenase reductase subunit [Verticillium alfalfae VaMs.102]EEY14229.1 3-chlorobenzoate-3,4-dioxygenase reductase subunit [Verticillium alfalfae VaMs.102]